MPNLRMHGPYDLDQETIRAEVTQTSPGNYALGRVDEGGTFRVSYVGRSDDGVADRLLDHVGEYESFKFSYATSPKAAFEEECRNYHSFKRLDNVAHPDRPDGTDWSCPICSRLD